MREEDDRGATDHAGEGNERTNAGADHGINETEQEPASSSENDNGDPKEAVAVVEKSLNSIFDACVRNADFLREFVGRLAGRLHRAEGAVQDGRKRAQQDQETIKKRETQVISAKQKAAALSEALKEAHEKLSASAKAVESLQGNNLELTNEIRELKEEKRVSRVVAIENENARLVTENDRLTQIVMSKYKKRNDRGAAAAATDGKDGMPTPT